MTQPIEIGRLLRAGTQGFVIGCRVSQRTAPTFGGMVRVPLEDGHQIYGLVHDIHIDDDGLVRQLITAGDVDQAIIADNRENRNIPLEVSVLAIGYEQGGVIYHLLPPRPPLSLDLIYPCTPSEVCAFTRAGRFGYLRHIMRAPDVPTGELLAAHIQQANQAHLEVGDRDWGAQIAQEVIVLLREDYSNLMAVLSALGDALPDLW